MGNEATKTTGENRAEPAWIPASGGEARWWGEALAVIKATGADTGGEMAMIEITEPPGAVAPRHVHDNEDEAFWILDGTAEFEVGGERFTAATGDYAFGPRGVPHSYEVGPGGCRMLFVLTPAGFEEMVRLISVPAAERTLPPGPQAPPEMENLGELVAPFGCRILDE